MNFKLVSLFVTPPTFLLGDDSIGASVLPLFGSDVTNIFDRSISEASDILEYWLCQFIHSTDDHSDFSLIENLRTVKDYFLHIRHDTLYFSNYKEDIHPLLIRLSYKFPAIDHLSESVIDFHELSFPFDIANCLLSIIIDRSCVGQHSFQLRQLVSHAIVSQFDPSIQKIVDDIYYRMQQKIRLTIDYWDRNIFKGFFDSEAVHSMHLIYLLLDDIFSIAGGSLRYDSDLFLERTPLVRAICEASFSNKLTIQALYSDISDDWLFNFSQYLSLGEMHPPSDIKLSVQDILDSPKFLQFLMSCDFLSQDQLSLLKQTQSSFSDSFSFDFSWLSFSNFLGCEHTTFNNLFVNLLLNHICHVLNYRFFEAKPPISTLSDFSSLNTKILREYFLEEVKPTPFTFSDIDLLRQLSTPNSEYCKYFIKPFFDLSMFMISHCDPVDAKSIFYHELSLHTHEEWCFNTLFMMLLSNSSATLELPAHRVLSSTGISRVPLLIRLIKEEPQTFLFYFTQDWLKLNMLFTVDVSPYPSAFHFIVKNSPELLNSLIHNDIDASLIACYKFRHRLTIFHLLAKDNPQSFLNLLSNKPFLLSRMSSLFTSKDYTPLHYVVNSDESSFYNHVIAGTIPFRFILSLNSNYSSPSFLFWLAKKHPKVLFDLFVNHGVSTTFLSYFSDKNDDTIYHILAKYNPSTFSQLIKEGVLSVYFVGSLKNIARYHPFHALSKYNKPYIEDLLSNRILTASILNSFMD